MKFMESPVPRPIGAVDMEAHVMRPSPMRRAFGHGLDNHLRTIVGDAGRRAGVGGRARTVMPKLSYSRRN